MKNIFEPSDFVIEKSPYNWVPTYRGYTFNKQFAETAANFANAKIKEWLEREAVVVYGWHEQGKKSEGFGSRIRPEEASHKALLINIEPIEKKKCEHSVVSFGTENAEVKYKCYHCNKQLKPNWVEVD